MTATLPCLAPFSSSTLPLPFLTFIGIHSCRAHSVPLLPSSWSINLQMCPSSCVRPSYAPRDIISLQLFLLRAHSRSLCLQEHGLFMWQLMVHSHALVHQCWCKSINSCHLFLFKGHWGPLWKFECIQLHQCIFSITCQQTLALLCTIMHAHVSQNSEFATFQHIYSNTTLV